MNKETGEIVYFNEGKRIPEAFRPILEGEMTSKQAEESQVSKYDNKSILGKAFTGNRAERRRQEREYRRKQKKVRRDNKNKDNE